MKIEESVANKNIAIGTLAVCAWCENYYQEDGEGCGMKCGDFFHTGFGMYKGPWQGSFIDRCCLCGNKASSKFNIKGQSYGLCEDEICMIEAEEICNGD
jgi:hypothetical protein